MVSEQGEHEDTSETRHRESNSLSNWDCVQVASCGCLTHCRFFSQNFQCACLNSRLGSAKPSLHSHLFLPEWVCYLGKALHMIKEQVHVDVCRIGALDFSTVREISEWQTSLIGPSPRKQH